MKSLSRTLGIFSIIIFLVGSVLFIPVYDYSTTFWERPSPDKHTYDFSDASSERDSRTLPHTETYLEVSEGVTILDAGESRTLTGIWVHGNGILVLNGCILNIREEDDGHRGEFNVTEDGTIHILNGSKVCIENGNFSARGKEFHMDGSILTVQNLTGGHTGIPGGGGAEIDGKSGHNSTLGIVTSEPVCIMDSEICCLGQSGGTGGAGVLGEVENGGSGGAGGNAEIIIDAPDVDINASTIRASGGGGGTGGERAHNSSDAEGGDGGKGGNALLSIHSFENIILRESNINSSGGRGGNASGTEGDELYGEGGRGGNSATELDALMSIEFEDCYFYSLRGDGGFGGERYMDGMWGKDDLYMEVKYNSILGRNSSIRISRDHLGVINLNPYGTAIFDNVSIFAREGDREKPYGLRGTNVIIMWPIFVRVIDDLSKDGIAGVDVSIEERYEFREWETIRNGLTDQNGYVRFYSITSRIMTGDDLCKDETVRIVAKKDSYKVEMESLFGSIYVTMTLDTISLEIEDISYRSVLVNDSKLKGLNVKDVESGWPLGGIIYINGTAEIASPTKTINKVEVSVNGMSASEIRDTSESGNWSRWSHRLDTVRKTGNGTETKIENIFDEEEVMLKFYAYHNNRYATVTEISLEIDQHEVNNPPAVTITRIGGIGLEELENQEIKIPPGKLKPIKFEGTLFDLDGNRISNGNLWVKVVPIDAGMQGSYQIISNSQNTEIDNLKGTWIVSWDLREIDFQSGRYEISVDVSDGDLNSSDSDHFPNEPIPVTIVLEKRPKVKVIILDERSIYEYGGGIYRDHGESSLFEINASTEPGVTIVEYHLTIRYESNGTIIFHYNGTNSSLPFTFENLDGVQPYQEYIVDVYVTDSRGYDSPSTEFPVMVDPEIAEEDTTDSQVGLTAILFIVLLLLIIVAVSVYFILERRGKGS